MAVLQTWRRSHEPLDSLFMVRPDKRRLIPMSYNSPVSTEHWDDDDSAAYKLMFRRIEQEGVVLVKPPKLKESDNATTPKK